jgi:hypothetical protein
MFSDGVVPAVFQMYNSKGLTTYLCFHTELCHTLLLFNIYESTITETDRKLVDTLSFVVNREFI